MEESEILTCDANNLYMASEKSISSSPKKSMTKQFALHRLDEINRAQSELHNRTWKLETLKPFVLRERGHIRKIQGNTPYDRMIMHSYIDNCLLPILSPYIIYDNYASQEGKGTSLARQRFADFLHREYRKNGNNKFYVLLMDFSKYYDNIRHDKLYDYVMQYLPHEEFHEFMLSAILDSFKQDVSWMTDEEYQQRLNTKYVGLDHIDDKALGLKYMSKSINIGNPVAQIFSIFFPTRIDNYCKIIKSIKSMGRYQDDIFIMHNNKSFLKELVSEIRDICNQMGIFINVKKTKICRVDHAFTWLHHQYRLSNSGHLYENLCSDSVTREKRKLKKQKKLLDDGVMEYIKIQNSFKSWIGANKKFLSRNQYSSICDLYNSLFINDWRYGYAN